ncbi:MAG: preprotein translocase subunit YajC [Streptosporangiaceae bacterium]|jgi:preprotein translocase subunit YajC
MGTFTLAANLAATTTKSSGSSYILLFIVVIFGIFYFVVLRPQRARQRAATQTQKTADPGTRIRTTAGMYGTIVSADDKDVVVEIAPGVQIKMLRRAIMEVVHEEDGVDAAPAAPPEPDAPAAGDDWDTKNL